MSVIKLQGDIERRKGIYYEFDPSEELLGEGGMGRVCKGCCIDEKTGVSRDVAIKFLYSDLPEDVIKRARREASIQLRNDNLVEMLGFIEIEKESVLGQINKRYHVVSELLEGVMLDDLLQGKTTGHGGKQIPFAQKLYKDYQSDSYHFALYVIRNILSGVMALHDAGYIHRDLDPTNIMVTVDEHIKIIDFGIAKQMNSLGTQDKALTKSGVFIGKPQYAAPELILGDVKSQNQTTDIYAIGIILFQLIVGHPPFEGAHHEAMDMQLHKKMPLKLISRRDVRKIVGIATNKPQSQRYHSASEFRVAVERLASLPYCEHDANLIKIAGMAASVIFIAGLTYFLWPSPKPYPDEQPVENAKSFSSNDRLTYNDAINFLKSPSMAKSGLYILDSLSEADDYNATFLLSRLYFKSKSRNDYCPDSIIQMQKNLEIKCNYKKAYGLLKRTIFINDQDYKALYELGCDFLGGASRTEAVERNIDTADMYLSKALEYASMKKDTYFINSIQKQMTKYKKGR
jgi:serine/threonine-protein kinase